MNSREKAKKLLGEFEIIAEIFAPLAKSYPGALDLKDDCAFLTPQKNHDLVLTKDALVSGVHFFEDDAPEDIAHKALAVNLSDLAGKGARPIGYLLAIALPRTFDTNWLRKFAKGLASLQKSYNCNLIGGDTTATPGSLTLSITAFGEVPKGKMVQRLGAKPGDAVYVTGTIGDAALGLKLRQQKTHKIFSDLSKSDQNFLLKRYLKPSPRLELASAVLSYAKAAMDISDGLVADLKKLCAVSQVGASIDLAAIPYSKAAQKILKSTPSILDLLVTGGDDYELLMSIKPRDEQNFEKAANKAGLSVTKIGQFKPSDFGVKFFNSSGKEVSFSRTGYDHFI